MIRCILNLSSAVSLTSLMRCLRSWSALLPSINLDHQPFLKLLQWDVWGKDYYSSRLLLQIPLRILKSFAMPGSYYFEIQGM